MIQIISPITVLLLAAVVVASLGVTDANVVHPIITHVLDVSKGRPGNRMRVQLYRQDSSRWIVFQDKFTNFDGRINDLIPRQNFSSGTYKLVYYLGKYFTKEGKDYYHPKADVIFCINDPDKLYQVTMIITPFSYVVSSVGRIEGKRSDAKNADSGGRQVKG